MGTSKTTVWRTNKAMQRALPEITPGQMDFRLPPTLERILAHGLVEAGGCVLLKELLAKAHTPRSYFPDATGYECFVNHLHLDDHVHSYLPQIGISFLQAVCERLGADFPKRRFRAILGGGGGKWDARFHTVRRGEIWLLEDFNSYDECLCVAEVGEVERSAAGPNPGSMEPSG